jgi:RNA polymerase sigma-70 factor (ECF subfamily)
LTDFATLYRQYAPDVYRFSLYLSGNRAEAEDIVSETFARIWSTADQIRTGTVKAYLLVIARNLYRTRLRKLRTRTELDEDLLDPKPGPEAAADARLELRRVLTRLQSLSEVDRAALLMQAHQGLSTEEIAVALGSSVAAVKVRIHRVRQKLIRIRSEEEGKA